MSAKTAGTPGVDRLYNTGDKVMVISYPLIPRNGNILRCFWHQDSTADHHGHQRYEVEVKGGGVVDVSEVEICWYGDLESKKTWSRGGQRGPSTDVPSRRALEA